TCWFDRGRSWIRSNDAGWSTAPRCCPRTSRALGARWRPTRSCSAPVARGGVHERAAMMNEREALDSFRSGRPRAVDVAEIERERKRVGRAAGGAETGGAVLRASMLNFIVHMSEPGDLSAVTSTVASVSAVLPCRAFVLLDAAGARPDEPLEAWISSHCQPT